MSLATCFLTATPILTHRPSLSRSTNTRPQHRRTLRCVLDERRSVDEKSTVTPSKRFYYFPTSEDVKPANYRVLPEDETEKPPRPPIHYTVPIIGYFLDLIRNEPTRQEKARRFGGIFTSSGFTTPMHHVTDYNAICEMMMDWQTFRSEGSSKKSVDMFGETAMILLDGERHTKARARFAPLFSAKVIPIYFEFVLKRAQEKWQYLSKQSASGKTMLLENELRDLYLAVGIQLTTGLTKNDLEYTKIIKLLSRLLLVFVSPRFGPIFDDAMKAREELIDIVSAQCQRLTVEFGDIIEEIREHGERALLGGKKAQRRPDVNMALLLLAAEEGIKPGVENDIKLYRSVSQKIYGLWVASYATSAVTSSCAIFEMLLNKDIMKIMRDEQEQIISESDGNRDVEYSQLAKMVKLESILNECLRLHPVVIGAMRKVSRDAEVFGKYIEKDSTVWFDYATAMLDDKYFANPDTFKWDRFLMNENSAPVPKVLTFGPPGMVHYCQGWQFAYMLMKTTFAIILREYTLMLDPNASTKYAVFPENLPKSKVAVSVIRPRELTVS